MHRLYEEGDITVFWDSEKCRHAKQCVTGCPEGFNINRKPWIQLKGVDTAKVWKAVSKCPSGALTCLYNHGVRIIMDGDGYRSVAYDGEKEIGECCFLVTPEGWNIYHTEVDDAYGGKGIAKRLVYRVVEAAERSGAAVKADCWYAEKVLG